MKRLSFRAFVSFAEKLHGHAVEAGNRDLALPYLVGSILTSWISLESFVNNMLEDYASLPIGTFSVYESAFLEEKQVRFNTSGKLAGTFSIGSTSEFKRIEDKVMFLVAKFGGQNLDKGGPLWQKFESVKEKRNALTHHRRGSDVEVGIKDSEDALALAKELIEFLSMRVWKKNIRW